MPKENFFKLGGIDSPPKLGGDASAASGEVPFGTTPGSAHFVREATPPSLGGELRAAEFPAPCYDRFTLRRA